MKSIFRTPIRFQLVPACVVAVSLTGCKPNIFDGEGYHIKRGAAWYVAGWTNPVIEIREADLATFHYNIKGWDDIYAKDKNHIYWWGHPIPGADAATFEALPDHYYRDKANVYKDDQMVCDDSAHFEQISGLFVKNSHAVYGLALGDPPEKRIVSTDVAHFRIIAPQASISIHADSKQLIVGLTVMTGIDPADFKFIGGSYWTDSRSAYDWIRPMPEGTDIATLEVLDGLQYAKDKRRVYYGNEVLKDADPATFVVTDPKWPMAKDANHVYNQGQMTAPPPLE